MRELCAVPEFSISNDHLGGAVVEGALVEFTTAGEGAVFFRAPFTGTVPVPGMLGAISSINGLEGPAVV